MEAWGWVEDGLGGGLDDGVGVVVDVDVLVEGCARDLDCG